jgi:hypothetical protein
VEAPIQSQLIKGEASDLILLREVLIETPVGDVWQVYMTDQEWKAWASLAVEIALRIGGTGAGSGVYQ